MGNLRNPGHPVPVTLFREFAPLIFTLAFWVLVAALAFLASR